MRGNERVILRIEKNPYVDGTSYLAAFPDEEALPGRIAAVAFHFEYGLAIFEPFCEVDLSYYYGTKPLHKTDDAYRGCLKALTDYYQVTFHPVERMAHGRRQPKTIIGKE